MKAVVQRRYGSAELGTLDVPTAGAGEVLLEVRAAGVDMGTWHLLTGKPYLLRVHRVRVPRAEVPGAGPGRFRCGVGDRARCHRVRRR